MAPNPFVYGAPATGDSFVGRQSELNALRSRIRNHINVVVTGPRRYGKTSLVTEAVAQLPKGAAVVAVNLVQCATPARLATEILRGTYRHSKVRHLEDFIRHLRVRPRVAFDDRGGSFELAPDITIPDLEAAISDAYGLLDQLSSPRRSVALVLDEFQDITNYGEHLPMLLKGLADQHPGVSLIVSGSQHHTMTELTRVRGAPLYGMAEHVALGPIPTTVMANFVAERARIGGKRVIRDAATELCDLAGPSPNDIQRLAFEVFECSGRTIAQPDLERGLRRVTELEAANYADRIASCSPTQRKVLWHLASVRGAEHPHSSAFAAAAGIASPATVQAALRSLERSELVTRLEGRFVLADPFFAAWLTQDP